MVAGEAAAADDPELQKASAEWRRAKRELIALEWAFERCRDGNVADKVVAAQARLEKTASELRRLARRDASGATDLRGTGGEISGVPE